MMAYTSYTSPMPCETCGYRIRYTKSHACVKCTRMNRAEGGKREGQIEDRMPGKIGDEAKIMEEVLYT